MYTYIYVTHPNASCPEGAEIPAVGKVFFFIAAALGGGETARPKRGKFHRGMGEKLVVLRRKAWCAKELYTTSTRARPLKYKAHRVPSTIRAVRDISGTHRAEIVVPREASKSRLNIG